MLSPRVRHISNSVIQQLSPAGMIGAAATEQRQMRTALLLALCLFICGCSGSSRSDTEARLSATLGQAEPTARRVRVSHYTASEDERVFCGIAIIDGRESSFRIEFIPPDSGPAGGGFAEVLHTPSIDNSPDRPATARLVVARLAEIMRRCGEDGLHLRAER